jgi:hypothetical protein
LVGINELVLAGPRELGQAPALGEMRASPPRHRQGRAPRRTRSAPFDLRTGLDPFSEYSALEPAYGARRRPVRASSDTRTGGRCEEGRDFNVAQHRRTRAIRDCEWGLVE